MTAAASSAIDAIEPRDAVDALLSKLRSERITYFPIRHHSPACAAHLDRWIAKHRPSSVLIEGPESFTQLVPFLADPRCQFPVAVYVNFIDQSGHLTTQHPSGNEASADDAESPAAARSSRFLPRFSAFYPFCDSSPEAVALRSGLVHGARVRFIDLEYPEQVIAQHGPSSNDNDLDQADTVRWDSLTSDPHLTHGIYTETLARRLGCRDFDELWDHLFESNWDTFETDEFINRLAAYCVMTRLSYRPEDLIGDGTTARETCMAAAIRDELLQNGREQRVGPVLVVTGGFHTVALPDLVAAEKIRRPATPRWKPGETGAWLMRYSFDQLDRLTGYASGMPSPAFYDRMWSITNAAPSLAKPNDDARIEAAITMLIEIGRETREKKFNPAVTTPDAMAAAQMVKQLAALRGHRWPQRQDLLDAVSSCFVKGETDVEGRAILQLVQRRLAGDRIGELPPGTGIPPIVDDFRKLSRQLKLPQESVEWRELSLDLYRDARQREISRLFHRLGLLDVPFAHFLRGPDFVQGVDLDLMNEHWRVAWSPAAESHLIEASVYGPTVADAAFAKLCEQIEQLADNGNSRNTAAAVTTLIRACRMGLHDQTDRLVGLIDEHIAEDPQLPCVAQGLAQLELLQQSLEPLGAQNLSALPRLLQAAYQRGCRLIEEIATCSDELIPALIESLKSIREIVQSAHQKDRSSKLDSMGRGFDLELFHQALQRVIQHPADRAQAVIVGAAAGILYGDGVYSTVDLVTVSAGYLGGSLGDPRKSCGIVRGILSTAREVAWHVEEILQSLDAQFAGWDEETFLNVLPDLRLAFAELTPREVSDVAERIAQLHDASGLGELVQMDLTEGDVQFALTLNGRVRRSLMDDGLLE